MRTTIRLDDEVATAARQLARRENLGFGEAVNLLARRGLLVASTDRRRYARPVALRSLGGARYDLTDTEALLELAEGADHA